MFYKNYLTDNEEFIYNNSLASKIYWETFESFYESYRSKMFKSNYNFIDLAELFKSSTDDDFIDFVHYSEKANEKIANTMSKEIHEIFNCK